MKRAIILILIFILSLPVSGFSWYEHGIYGDMTYETDGITVNYICRGISSVEDGKPIIVTAVEGAAETIIEVADIDGEKLLRTFNTGITGTMWYGCADSKGNVYCCIGRNIVIYSPVTKTIKNAGYVPTTWSGTSNGIVAACDDIVYGVTSAYGNVYKCENGVISTLYTLPNVYSMGGIAVIDDYIYAGGTYNGTDKGSTYVYRINRFTNQVDTLPNPLLENISSVGHIYACGRYVIAQLSGYSRVKKAYFYDTQTGAWLDKTIEFNENGMSDPCGGKLFYVSGGIYHGIDIETLEITDYPNISGYYHRGNGMAVRCEGFSGECFVNIQYNGNLYVISPEDNQVKHLDIELVGAPAERRISRVGSDGKVYVTAFMGSDGICYDPDTKQKQQFSIGQGEGAVSYNGKMYIGVYPGGLIYELDMDGDYISGQNPKLICDIGEDQDRPFGMDIVGDKLVVGTLPAAGKVGGAVTIIDLSNYSAKTYRNIIPGHSVLTVTHKDNKIYCGTTVCSGSGTVPAQGGAHVFCIDADTGEAINDTEFCVPGVNVDIGAVHGLRISPYDGKLYGAAAGIDFVMDPDTLELLDYNVYSENFDVASGASTQIWHEYYMEFYGGYLFRTNAVIDPNTMDIVDSLDTSAQFAGIAGSKAYFVSGDTSVYSVDINLSLEWSWDFDNIDDLPEGFTVNNENIYRYDDQTGPSAEMSDRGFGWVIGIGVGKGDGVIGKYTNGFNILKSEIGEKYLNNTKIAVNMDFMIKNDSMTAYLVCPRFGQGNTFGCQVQLENGVITAGGQRIGTLAKDEWHNIGVVYTLSETDGVVYDVYYDGNLAASGLKDNSDIAKSGVSCFCILTNAYTSDEDYLISNRFDTRGEKLYIDNLYIGENTDNVRRECSYYQIDDSVIINAGAYDAKGVLISASYDENTLLGVSMDNIELEAREKFVCDITNNQRIFFWDSTENMKPYSRQNIGKEGL